MKLLTKKIESALPALRTTETKGFDATVHVKFFTPDSSWTWFATEFDPAKRLFFGWATDGRGDGELGYFSLDELEEARGPYGLKVERDLWFDKKTLKEAIANVNR